MTPRLAVVRDFRAEGWPSMDLCADQLLAHLPAADLAPPFRRLFTRLPFVGRRNAAFNADRVLNRHVFLPYAARRAAGRFDLFHVVDHSYAHVVAALPPGRAGVYCHDLDAFRPVLDPARDPRPWWFRRLAHRTLDGLRRAAVVFHSTAAVREQILGHDLVSSDRLVHAPYGVAAEFTAVAGEDPRVPGVPDGRFLLHVGGNVPRKRLDVLLDAFAAVRKTVPGLKLVQVGGPWPQTLADRLARLGVGADVVQVRGLTRGQLAALYRRAAAVLVPSEAEGFGLPVIEAMACGAVVVASDIPPLREAGGGAAVFCPVADVPSWSEAVTRILADPAAAPSREARLAHAATFTWPEHARVIGRAYHRLARGEPPGGSG